MTGEPGDSGGGSRRTGRGTGKFGDLGLRVLSALVIAAAALACIWAGGWWIAFLAAAATGQMIAEWATITGGGRRVTTYLLPLALGLAMVPLAVEAGSPLVGFAVIGLAIVWVAVSRALGRSAGLWDVLGCLYIGTAAIAFIALRGVEPFGFLSILWAALVVVAADVGGYFAGRLIGGPKLWPAISPKKTWAGLGGGIALAIGVGGVFSGATTGTYFYEVCSVSVLAALLAQAGDLAESALKRHFGVKDAGALIPGHGGVLDRMDGQMAAILVAAAVTFSRGQPVFIW